MPALFPKQVCLAKNHYCLHPNRSHLSADLGAIQVDFRTQEGCQSKQHPAEGICSDLADLGANRVDFHTQERRQSKQHSAKGIRSDLADLGANRVDFRIQERRHSKQHSAKGIRNDLAGLGANLVDFRTQERHLNYDDMPQPSFRQVLRDWPVAEGAKSSRHRKSRRRWKMI
jgi:hypothetical protein